jgi:thiol-disulfide isomerase/thioredoxin
LLGLKPKLSHNIKSLNLGKSQSQIKLKVMFQHRFNYRIALFLLFLVFYSCNRPKPTTKNTNLPVIVGKNGTETSVKGTIKNNANSEIYFYHPQYNDTAQIHGDNTFLFRFNLTTPAYFNLNTHKKSLQLFVSPGDSITLVFDTNDIFNTVDFSGTGAIPNQYLKSKYQLLLQQAIPLEHLYNQSVRPFRHLVDSFYVVQKIHLQDFSQKHRGLSEAFMQKELAALKYDRATKLMEYPKSSSYAHKIKPEYFNFLNKLNVNDSSLIHQYEFKTFLKAFVEYYASEKLAAQGNKNYSPVDYTLAKMQTLVQKIESPAIRNQWLFTILNQHIKYYGYKNTELLFEFYSLQNTNKALKQKLLEPFEKYRQLKNNKNVSALELETKNGQTITLNTFKGKYIYIDVWATWCMPCRKEAPYFEALKQKYSHKNVVFVSVSVDRDKKDWLEYISFKNMHYNQYRVKDADAFLNEFMIKTIPHYILINPRGEIEQPIAPRPTEKNEKWLKDLPDKPTA